MRLPKNLLDGTYGAPSVLLCETDKTKIGQLNVTNMKGTFKFNSYSELNFDISRTDNDLIFGDVIVNPYYDKVEALRQIYLEGFGYFEIQKPEISSDGIKEIKSITAYSLEYMLSQKYLSSFYVNNGEVDSREVIYDDIHNTKNSKVVLYDPSTPELSLLHLILEKIYGWRIGHVDMSLRKMNRIFEIDRESVYDFLINDICDKFNCYIVFDTDTSDGINTINVYAEALTSIFYGDNETRSFSIVPPYASISSVSVCNYKTTQWVYNPTTGLLTFDTAPNRGDVIEVVDGSQTDWETDVFVNFDNLSQEITVDYNADDIKTVLTVTGGDDLDIREVNLGRPYITDLSYYYTKDWMGEELYDAYTEYLISCNRWQNDYTANAQSILELDDRIIFERDRVSLEYSEAIVTSTTTGTYYIRGGDAPNYYYTEVSLPNEYNANNRYYTLDGVDLTREKINTLYNALQSYYSTTKKMDKLEELIQPDDITNKTPFGFMDDKYSLEDLIDKFKAIELDYLEKFSLAEAEGLEEYNKVKNRYEDEKSAEITLFFNLMWNQYGLSMLNNEKSIFESVQKIHIEAGWADKSSEKYDDRYLIDVIIINTINNAISQRDEIISNCKTAKKPYTEANAEIIKSTELTNFLQENYPDTYDKLLIRLTAFLREDQYSDDNFFVTSADGLSDSFKIEKELLECGKIELNKRSQPKLSFSMDMANIYALPEFHPIINQFQLGKLIKIALRPDYIKRSRLLQVDINFDDSSDFSCDFGELCSLRSPIDVHADLLSQAVQAGKSVASNASYWNKSTNKINEIDTRLQNGLLDAATSIKSIDGTQDAFIDQYGIHLQKKDPQTGEIDPHQGWIVNNKFLYSDDGFKTTKSAFGEFQIDDTTYYGLLADAVVAGYIEGSKIVGGSIQIGKRLDGDYNFEVSDTGVMTFRGGEGVAKQISDLEAKSNVVSDLPPEEPQVGQLWIDITSSPYTVKTYNGESWDVVKTQTGDNTNVFAQKPENKLDDGMCYHSGDLWIVGEDYQPYVYSNGVITTNKYAISTILVCTTTNSTYSDADWQDANNIYQIQENLKQCQSDLEQYSQVMKVFEDGLYLFGINSEDHLASFYSRLSSGELGFWQRDADSVPESEDKMGSIYDPNNKVRGKKIVWIGNKELHAKETIIEGSITVDPSETTERPFVKIGSLTIQKETNGSYSIVV